MDKRRRQRLTCFLSLLALLTLGWPQTGRADDQPLCFAQTQQCLLNATLRDYWLKNGGLPVFGYPTTHARGRTSPQGSYLLSQWFERNRLELHPENAAPYNVLLGRLGDEVLRLAGRDPASLPKGSSTADHYYPAVGHAIAPQFWDYWHSHGLDLGDAGISERESLALFGYPISEATMERASTGESLLTQWFERARFEYHPNNPDSSKVELGLLGNEIQPTSPQRALTQANRYRTVLGLPPLELHPAVVAAAQHHADYFLLNYRNQAAQEFGAHGEVAGQGGFTGKWPSDRIKVTGYPYFGGAEVMAFTGDPADSVDQWMATIYHRLILIDPNARYTGYGYGSRYDSDKQQQVAVDVMDFGGIPDNPQTAVKPYPLAYPADGQSGIPTYWDGGEAPDPLPAGASRPVGYPFTLQGVNGSLRVDYAQLRDATGQPVTVHLSPADCKGSCYALIAVNPLRANSSYSVQVRGAIADLPFDRTWRFSTGDYKLPPR